MPNKNKKFISTLYVLYCMSVGAMISPIFISIVMMYEVIIYATVGSYPDESIVLQTSLFIRPIMIILFVVFLLIKFIVPITSKRFKEVETACSVKGNYKPFKTLSWYKNIFKIQHMKSVPTSVLILIPNLIIMSIMVVLLLYNGVTLGTIRDLQGSIFIETTDKITSELSEHFDYVVSDGYVMDKEHLQFYASTSKDTANDYWISFVYSLENECVIDLRYDYVVDINEPIEDTIDSAQAAFSDMSKNLFDCSINIPEEAKEASSFKYDNIRLIIDWFNNGIYSKSDTVSYGDWSGIEGYDSYNIVQELDHKTLSNGSKKHIGHYLTTRFYANKYYPEELQRLLPIM